jgi:excisionase family DNA binding protein
MQTELKAYEFMDINEASTLLKLKVSTLYAWVYQRKIPFRKHGSRIVFEKGELCEWSEKRRVPMHLTPTWDPTEAYGNEAAGSLKTRRNDETP